jgi:hypothetical protein
VQPHLRLALDERADWHENYPMKEEKSASDMRKARLAQALRANLSRRKAQARNRQAAGTGDGGPGPASEAEESCPN